MTEETWAAIRAAREMDVTKASFDEIVKAALALFAAVRKETA